MKVNDEVVKAIVEDYSVNDYGTSYIALKYGISLGTVYKVLDNNGCKRKNAPRYNKPLKCDECGRGLAINFKYCPFCGKKIK